MLVKSEGIIISGIKYGENSKIVKIFTKRYGLLSFMIHKLQGKNSVAAVYQNGNFIEFDFYYQYQKNLKTIKESKLQLLTTETITHEKLLIVQFYCEVLDAILSENFADEIYFTALKKIWKNTFEAEENKHLPIHFLLATLQILGHAPAFLRADNNHDTILFSSIKIENNEREILSFSETEIHICNEIYALKSINTDANMRRIIFDKILNYFQSQFLLQKQFTSPEIIRHVLE